MIREVEGDLFTSDLDALAHGCNCVGAMGGGIAVEFKRNWPTMYAEYRRRCLTAEFNLGDVYTYTEPSHGHGSVTIFNLATQILPGANANLYAIRLAVYTALEEAKALGITAIGIPRIGAGIGGLDWEEVKVMLHDAADNHAVDLIIYTLPIQK